MAGGRLRGPLRLTRRQLSLGILALTTGAARAQETPAATIRFSGGATETGWIGFAQGPESVILTVEVNGRPVQAILDNGASQTTLDLRLAKALGLTRGGGVEVEGMSGPAGAAFLQPITVRIGALTLALPTPIVVDLQRSGVAQSMLLGREVFEHLIVDLDLPNQRLAFHQPGTFTPPAGLLAAPLISQGSRARLTPIVLEDQPPVLGMFDLGSQEALAISAAYAASRKLGAGRRVARWVSGGVEGVEEIGITTLSSVRLGGARLADVPTSLVTRWNRPESPVNIGMPLLSRYRLVTDYGRDRLWLGIDQRAARAPFVRNRSGLACLLRAGVFDVVFVAPGSPGEAAGFHAGDRITAVNGATAVAAGRAWGGGPAGDRVTLTLADGRQRTLTLADYF